MKSIVTIIALGSLLVGSTAFAIIDEGVNSLGVYFDYPTCEINCLETVGGMPASMYVVMANCSQDSIGGFEFSWFLDPDPVGQYFVLGVILPPNALNIGDNNNLIVGLAQPLITAEATLLAEVQMLFLVSGVIADIVICPATPASIPGFPVFNDGANPALLFPMILSTGIPGPDGCAVVGTLGCPGPIATESSTLSNVKALFR